MGEIPKLEISENHQRRLSSTLRLVDETLCIYRQWAEGGERHSIFYHEINNLSFSQRQAILGIINEIMNLLSELKEVFDLGAPVQEIGRTFLGQNAMLWSSIVEMHSRYLKGYGALSKVTKDYLDPKIDDLEELIKKLSSVVLRSDGQIDPGE